MPRPHVDTSSTVQTLQHLMDRLGASDLTAVESDSLRPCLFELLHRIERERDPRTYPALLVPDRSAVA